MCMSAHKLTLNMTSSYCSKYPICHNSRFMNKLTNHSIPTVFRDRKKKEKQEKEKKPRHWQWKLILPTGDLCK